MPDLASPCRACHHARDVHVHLRPGSECSVCDCQHYRGPGRLSRLLRALGVKGEDGQARPQSLLAITVAVSLGAAAVCVVGPTQSAAAAARHPGASSHQAHATSGDRHTSHRKKSPHKKRGAVHKKKKPAASAPTPAAVTTATPLPASAVASRSTAKPLGISYGDRLTWMSDADLAATLDDAVALHATWIRTDLSWADLQPSSSTRWSWSRTDRVVAAAQARGLRVLGVLAYTPTWARSTGCTGQKCPPADAAAFTSFTQAVASRYQGQVSAYEIWNEENIPAFWTNPDAARYAALLGPAAAALKHADPKATVLMGGLAANDGKGSAVRPSAFVEAVCDAGACGNLDAIAYHPYTFPYLASRITTWHTPWERIADSSAGDPSLLSVLSSIGRPGLPVWITEFGAPTGGPGTVTDSNLTGYSASTDHVTEDLQARIVSDGIATGRADAAVGAMFIYTDRDVPTAGSNSGYYGLRRADGTAKPAYAAAQGAFAP